MNKIVLSVVVLLILIALFAFGNSGQAVAVTDEVITIHKSPTCGCCSAYAKYLDNLGYEVNIHETEDLSFIKAGLGVPRDLESCHTTEIEGYIIEGHIPHQAIVELFSSKPEIKGIGLPGMPTGSPGMGGPKTKRFVVREILENYRAGETFLEI